MSTAHLHRIIDLVATQTKVEPVEMLGNSRMHCLTSARAMYCKLARRFTNASFPEIAAAICRTNHSSVVSSIQLADRRIEADEQFREVYEALALAIEQWGWVARKPLDQYEHLDDELRTQLAELCAQCDKRQYLGAVDSVSTMIGVLLYRHGVRARMGDRQ